MLPLLLEKARHNGIAALAINRCVHFSALFADIEPLTEAGLVGLACTPSHAWVAPAGGTRPLFGTNPIAFGWPRQDKPPFIVDMATSAAARGEIQLHQRAGKALPEGWGIDSQGQPTTDAAEVLNGAMLTFGGHKGSALAAMVELLAGPLIGDMTSAESLAWDNGAGGLPYGGELILALDPQRFLGAQAPEQLARAETLFNAMQDQGARLPDERRFACRQQSERQGSLSVVHCMMRFAPCARAGKARSAATDTSPARATLSRATERRGLCSPGKARSAAIRMPVKTACRARPARCSRHRPAATSSTYQRSDRGARCRTAEYRRPAHRCPAPGAAATMLIHDAGADDRLRAQR